MDSMEEKKMDYEKIFTKIKSWQIGAIIGGVIGLIVGYFIFTCHGEECVLLQLLPPILASISFFISVMIIQEILHIDSNNSILVMTLFLSFFTLLYVVVGSLLGKLYSFLKIKGGK